MSTEHYEKIAENFEDNWFFDKNYRPFLLKAILENLSLKMNSSFLDLGCGTGLYTQGLIELAKAEKLQVTGVDFSESMIEEFSAKNQNYIGVVSDLESFVAQQNKQFDSILVKEVIHHIKEPHLFFKNFKKNILNNKSETLIITRPQEVEFPFFESALLEFKKGQIGIDPLLEVIQSVDLNVDLKRVSIPISVAKDHMYSMIKNRFMSTFDIFSDDELSAGLDEYDKTYKKHDTIQFDDHLLFVKVRL